MGAGDLFGLAIMWGLFYKKTHPRYWYQNTVLGRFECPKDCQKYHQWILDDPDGEAYLGEVWEFQIGAVIRSNLAILTCGHANEALRQEVVVYWPLREV